MTLNTLVPFPKAHRLNFLCGKLLLYFYAWQIDLWAFGMWGWETVFQTWKVHMPIMWTQNVHHFVQINALSRFYFWIIDIHEIWLVKKVKFNVFKTPDKLCSSSEKLIFFKHLKQYLQKIILDIKPNFHRSGEFHFVYFHAFCSSLLNK